MKKETNNSLKARAEKVLEQGGTGREIALLIALNSYKRHDKEGKPFLTKKMENELKERIGELPPKERRAALKYTRFSFRVIRDLSKYQDVARDYTNSVLKQRLYASIWEHAEADAKLFEIICKNGLPYTDSQADTEARKAIKEVLNCYEGIIFLQDADGSISLNGSFFDDMAINAQYLEENLKEYLLYALTYEYFLNSEEYADFLPEYAEVLTGFLRMEPALSDKFSKAHLRELKEQLKEAEKNGEDLTFILKDILLIESKGYNLYFPDVEETIKGIDESIITEKKRYLTDDEND